MTTRVIAAAFAATAFVAVVPAVAAADTDPTRTGWTTTVVEEDDDWTTTIVAPDTFNIPTAKQIPTPPRHRTPVRHHTHRTTHGTHTVRPGDTLWDIAQANRTTVDALVAANARRHPSLRDNPDLILIDWTLRIR